MKSYKIFTILVAMMVMFTVSCTKDLNTAPIDPLVTTSATVFNNAAAYKQALAKLYASMAVSGQKIDFSQPDIQASDQGTACFLREFWAAEEVTTDECINAWGDGGLVEYHGGLWSDQNLYVQLMYERIFVNIAYCNEYVRDVSAKLGSLPSGLSVATVQQYLAEARFLRAYFYECAMDMYGNVPFATEAELPGTFLPKQISRGDLFKYIESELIAIQPMLAAPGTNEYARIDQAADWALLSRMYLNAQVYTGTQRYTDCITYANKIIQSGKYSLHSNYQQLFLADNNLDRDEIILPLAEDGVSTESYGDVTFIIHAGVGGSEDATNEFGIASGGWAGNRMTNTFVTKVFPDASGNTDKRAIFYTAGQKLGPIADPTIFSEGYLSAKWKNVTSAGVPGSNNTFVDTDFPLFRLGEVYLNYAEAVLRGGSGGDAGTALTYINALRTRAYGNTGAGTITAAQLTLSFMIDERGRELYWEMFRRTDLIRFGLFTGSSYLWDWKGNVMAGTGTDAHLNIFPLPASDLQLNSNLKQNPGYGN
ncbi:Starch-binding associating with outer membrane [Mucilaginibacter mallensis]|uniref:Starch-binding associating with outer membrane n=1 Tax=Mucilaginibacter mallensis TaxID=652787 RepID=A0A1H1THJ0_MUCMA|nr:RagB/SusD family nutrient uptake outer membrane protein [Mucilaginibacter mallensis]SDS59702.1 Starch-binding associating with outer membrane [Mucilaginibacter mallensis]